MFFQLSKSLFYRVVQVFLYAVFLAICLMSIKYYMEFYNANIESQNVTKLDHVDSEAFQKTIEDEDLGLEGQVKRIAADPSHRQTKQSDVLGRLLTSGGFLG